MLNRPTIDDIRIAEIERIILLNPTLKQNGIAKCVCEQWNWKFPNGKLKICSCTDMLQVLNKHGKITLPPKTVYKSSGKKHTILHYQHDTRPISGHLSDLQPICVEPVITDGGKKIFCSLVSQYHYLSLDRAVGRSMKYFAKSSDGRILGCLLFGSAAWKCRDRDAWIGWDAETRKRNLQLISNNSRFLILPWVTIPNLASHILSLVSQRISADWEKEYGHGLAALETFVEFERFTGACYRAANWKRVGVTEGRGRNDFHNLCALSKKDIYVYPLERKCTDILTGRKEKWRIWE
jgi:hypothetical protein